MIKDIKILTAGTIVSIIFSVSREHSALAANPKQGEGQPMNVWFPISDDMLAEMNVLGSPMAQTPNLDKLAKDGVCFERAYCQYPLPCPSRSSILTGRRPTTSGLYTNREWFGASYPDWISLPNYFRFHGYETLRSGKIFHGGIDDTEAWTEGGEQRVYNNPVNANLTSTLRAENEHGKGITGVVVRTEQWRYAEFFGAGAGAFLTDPIHDPDEFVNLVYDPGFSEVIKQLHKLASAYVAGKTELPPKQLK